MDRSRLALHKNAIKSLAKACATSEFPTCARCILRYCNVKQVFTSCSYGEVVADLISLLTPPESSPLADKLNGLCGSCLNVLSDDFVAEASAKIKASITENGYSESLENFQLLIHLPIILTLRNNYFQKTFNVNDGEIIGIKELFKVYLATKLSKLLGVKLNAESRFMIELTFTNPNGDKECDQLVDIVPDTFYQKKCRKSSAESFVNHSSVMRVISQLNGDSLSQLRLSNVAEKCILEDIALKNEAIYIAGRYLKYSRKLSQTPWIVDGGALFMSSVQERITGGVVRYIECKDIKFSSSGREDVDVRMLGRGRPFLLEVSNPRPSTNEQLMEKIKAFISESCEDVRVRDLQIVDKENCQKFLKEGEDSKTKTYQALCCINRPYTEADFELLRSNKDMKLTQKTPIRVLHRRTLSDRTRTVYEMWPEEAVASELEEKYRPFADRIFKLNLVTEAGTYIKEFVHSDFGRTTPNLCSILGNCSADIITLDVMEVNVNWPPIID